METIRYEKIWEWENLLAAYRKAARGKRGKPAAAAFEFRLEDNLVRLSNALRCKTYRPGAYDSFFIHDPKRRLISAAPFADRVVHHALCNVIAPHFERSFIFDTYANRLKKGTHRAIDRAQAFARRFRYVLPCDIRQFFPSIDHEVMRAIIGGKIRDPDVMWLVDQILASGVGVLKKEYDPVSPVAAFLRDQTLAGRGPEPAGIFSGGQFPARGAAHGKAGPGRCRTGQAEALPAHGRSLALGDGQAVSVRRRADHRNRRASRRLEKDYTADRSPLARAAAAGADRKRPGFCAAARSTTIDRTCAAPTATGTIPTTGTTTSVFVLSSLTVFFGGPEMPGGERFPAEA